MPRSVALHRSCEWKMALDNLVPMHPRYLASLWQDRTLAEVLRQRVVAYFETLERLQQAYPHEPDANLQEMAQSDVLVPVNIGWQDQEPLDDQERELLRRYRHQPTVE